MTMSKSKKILDIINESIKYKRGKMKLKIPSFTLSVEVYIEEKDDPNSSEQEVSLEFSKHNITQVLEEVVPKVVADELNKRKLTDKPVDNKKLRVTTTTGGFPNGMIFFYKK